MRLLFLPKKELLIYCSSSNRRLRRLAVLAKLVGYGRDEQKIRKMPILLG
ncbi:hypothetical protein B4168_2529 [Anoxybacillus flavithermus]|nr:hypothetical protein B4168_2529 [Anoxybacillus flavithermus]OAO85251.1 hypothetical protein GT23_2942 [Parageobacillus thermoglucosidasius]